MNWEDPKLWVLAAGIVGQAMIAWWRVGNLERRADERKRDVDGQIRDLWRDVEALREWRAQVREQIRQLQNGRQEADS